MKNILKIKNQIYISMVYTLVMGFGWLINPHPYGDIENVIFMIPILGVLGLLSIYLIKINKLKYSADKTKGSLILWMFLAIIGYLAFSNYLVYAEKEILGPIYKILLLFAATMLVGIAEEGVYRGYILNSVEKKVGLRKALLYSSVLFGLMHSVNFIAGPTIAQTVVQVLLTTAVGYVFGVIYLSTNRNLILVMFLHGIYDFLVFNFSYLVKLNDSDATNFLTLPLLIFVWLISALYWKKYRQKYTYK